MTDRIDESRDSDEAIWRDAVTLEPEDTKDAKVHVTLRLDPNVYRAIIAERKAAKDRTITATIERLLSKGLEKTGDRADVVSHSAVTVDQRTAALGPAGGQAKMRGEPTRSYEA